MVILLVKVDLAVAVVEHLLLTLAVMRLPLAALEQY
jgi:hypothetical protein